MYTGWKSGEFTMDRGSAVYLSEVGCCGEAFGPTLLKLMVMP